MEFICLHGEFENETGDFLRLMGDSFRGYEHKDDSIMLFHKYHNGQLSLRGFPEYEKDSLMMFVFVKTHGRELTECEGILVRAMGTLFSGNNRRFIRGHERDRVNLSFRGVRVLRLENTSPSDSKWMEFDGEKIDEDSLVNAIRLSGYCSGMGETGTKKRRSSKEETAFGKWTRGRCDLDSIKYKLAVTDADIVSLRRTDPEDDTMAREGNRKNRIVYNLVLYELKKNNAVFNRSQDDTLIASEKAVSGKIYGKGRAFTIQNCCFAEETKKTDLRFYGWHGIRMSGSSPDHSDKIELFRSGEHNPVEIDAETFSGLVSLKISPYTMRAIEYRRRHRAKPGLKGQLS